jgi:hypothetical protein
LKLNRRELFSSAGVALAAAQLPAQPPASQSTAAWLTTCRTMICEAYNPPFYPSLDYEPAKAIQIATTLNADSLRYPAASYFAYFPTKSSYPVHPELKRDPFRETVDLAHKNGLKVVAYVPLNHPFMDVTSKDPRYKDWSKKFADGTPMSAKAPSTTSAADSKPSITRPSCSASAPTWQRFSIPSSRRTVPIAWKRAPA